MGRVPDLTSGDYVRLVHWKAEEVPERATMLEVAGYQVDPTVPGTSIGLRALSKNPPVAVVIDLSRLPSHGREVGRALRGSKSLRGVPLVFVAGAADKVAQAREEFPDASFCDWEAIGTTLENAIANPPADPVVPVSDAGPRSATPLAKKLGVRASEVIALVDAPDGFEATLGDLPADVRLTGADDPTATMFIWFVSESDELVRRMRELEEEVAEGTLWVAWPKGSSPLASDLREDAIRDAALPLGMVDSKVCAIDDDWSGLRLTRRRRSN